MSTAKDFLKILSENDAWKAELEEKYKDQDHTTEEAKFEALAAFAKTKGYDVEVEDICMAKASTRKDTLSDAELAAVAGGVTPEESVKTCFLDYSCMGIWNACNVSNECTGSYRCDTAQSLCSQNDFATNCDYLFWYPE